MEKNEMVWKIKIWKTSITCHFNKGNLGQEMFILKCETDSKEPVSFNDLSFNVDVVQFLLIQSSQKEAGFFVTHFTDQVRLNLLGMLETLPSVDGK